MEKSSTPRRILKDLPVNAFGAPGAANASPSSNYKPKRQIHEVDDPAPPPLSTRPRVSDHGRPSVAQLRRETPAPARIPTPCPVPEDCENSPVEANTQDTSTDTISTMVDSDMEGDTADTQETAATEITQATRSTPLSRADTLRLRLRFAMFKIETDQMNVPLALVRIPTPDAHTIGSPANPSPPRDPESHPTLLPAPILTPTTSARTSRRPEMLSSPPCSARGSPVKRCSPQVFRTPALPRQRAQPIQQTSSPPDSRAGSVGRGEVEETRLSSSAVKGHAAISLLGLKDDRR